jgi:acrylyl-CoA reductase (NADPH)
MLVGHGIGTVPAMSTPPSLPGPADGTGPGPGASSGLPDTVRAFVVDTGRGPDAGGGPDGVGTGVRLLPTRDLGPGDVVIAVEWSAINYKDAMVTRPANRVARISPLVPGVDLVGTVVAGGDDSVPVGSKAIAHGYDLGVAHHGGFSELARVPAGWVVPLPAGLTARQAAIIGTAGFTAALSLERLERHGLSPEDGPVLVTGATGGVGSMAVSLLAGRGYQVVASSGKRTATDYLIGLGATEVISRDELNMAPDRTLGPERWAGAVDCVGGGTLAAVLRSLGYGAAVAASGLTGGNTFESSVYPFIVRNASLIGIDTVLTPIDERRRVWESLAGAYDPVLLDSMVDDQIGLEALGPALDRILAGGARGRVLVDPNS